MQLKKASKTVASRELLIDALIKFGHITNIPENRKTAGFSNAQLRSLAFLGIAAVHLELKDTHASSASSGRYHRTGIL